MIKNQLYPYLEKYINDYLYGFTKEQLNVGLMNGIIVLDALNIKPDRVNEKLDKQEIPIWLKAGMIKKIKIGASLMNFIGEKPLEVSVEEIDCVVSPSFKWILKNLPTFIEENEYHIKEAYDPMDNNSHDIFSRKVNIYDSSVIKKGQKLFEIFSDKNKISEIINKIFTKCLKFYYQKAYLVNLKVKNVHVRFEDDQLLNFHSNLGLGVRISNLELNLSADGVSKKNSFKCEGLNLYWESSARILIPSKTFIESLDKDNNISEKYYEYLKGIRFEQAGKGAKLLVENFNCMGNFGIQIIESGNLDFFAKNREKNYKFFVQVATSELNLNLYPDILKIAERVVDFMRSFFIIESIQDFKPMRKPYSSNSGLVQGLKNDQKFSSKRKLVIRDWFYYLIWFNRFKKAIYGNAFKNNLQSEFSKYFNICCLPPVNEDGVEKENSAIASNLNDSIYLKKGINTSQIDPVKKESLKQKEEDLNPENINLKVQAEVLIKGVNINIHPTPSSKISDVIIAKLTGLEIKCLMIKEKCDFTFDVKHFLISNKNKVEVNKSIEEKLKNDFSIANGLGVGKAANKNFNLNLNYINETYGNENQLSNQYSNQLFSPPHSQFEEDTVSNHNNSVLSNTTSGFNPKLNKKLSILNETLDQLSKNANGGASSINKFKISNSNQNKQKVNFVNILLADENGTSGAVLNTNNDFHQEKSKNVNLSKIINEYNKNMVKQKKTVTVTSGMSHFSKNKVNNLISHSNTNSNLEEKVILNILEITPASSSSAISIKFSKQGVNVNNQSHSQSQKKVLESATINLGLIRFNIVQDYISSTLPLITEYPFLNRLESKIEMEKKKVSGMLNLKEQKNLYDLKNLILHRLSKKNKDDNNLLKPTTNLTNTEITDYTNYVKKDLQFYDKNLLENGGLFEVNYIFNLFNNKNIEINCSYSNFICIVFSGAATQGHNISGKIKLPSLNLKLSLQNENFIFRLFDLDVNFSDNDNLRMMLGQVFLIIKEKLKMNLILLEPMMKKIMEEMTSSNVSKGKNVFEAEDNSLKKLSSKNGFSENSGVQGKKKGSNFQLGLNIIQNNMMNEKKAKETLTSKNLPVEKAKKEEHSLTESLENTSYLNVNIPSSTGNIYKNKEMNEIPPIVTEKEKVRTQQYTETIQNDYDDQIINSDSLKSYENISDYEDLGISVEKEGQNENVKRIQSYNKIDSVRTEESKDRAKPANNANAPDKKNLKNINMK